MGNASKGTEGKYKTPRLHQVFRSKSSTKGTVKLSSNKYVDSKSVCDRKLTGSSWYGLVVAEALLDSLQERKVQKIVLPESSSNVLRCLEFSFSRKILSAKKSKCSVQTSQKHVQSAAASVKTSHHLSNSGLCQGAKQNAMSLKKNTETIQNKVSFQSARFRVNENHELKMYFMFTVCWPAQKNAKKSHLPTATCVSKPTGLDCNKNLNMATCCQSL